MKDVFNHRILTLKSLLFSVALLGFLVGCKKSPKELWESWSVKKLFAKRTSIVSEKDDDKASTEKQSLDTAEEEALDLSETDPVHVACVKFLQRVNNEPWFYHLQASIRKSSKEGQPGELVRGHLKYRGLIKKDLAAKEPAHFNDCADLILDIESYPDLKKFKSLPLQERLAMVAHRSKSLKTAHQPVSQAACFAFAKGFADVKEFKQFKSELSAKQKQGDAEQFLMESIQRTTKDVDTAEAKADFTIRECLMALRKIHSFEQIAKLEIPSAESPASPAQPAPASQEPASQTAH